MIITQNFNSILTYAQEEAQRLQCPRVEPEHLLLAIIRLGEGSAYELLLQAKFDPAEAKKQLDNAIRAKALGLIEEKITRSAQTDRILRIAEGIGREYQAEVTNTVHLLLAIMREQINHAAAYLENEWGLSYQQLVDLYGQPHYSPELPQDGAEQMGDLNEGEWQPQRGSRNQGATKALDKYQIRS